MHLGFIGTDSIVKWCLEALAMTKMRIVRPFAYAKVTLCLQKIISAKLV